MPTLASLLGSLDDTKRALLALIVTLAFGVSVGIAVVGFVGLPSDVAANTEGRRRNQVAIDSLRTESRRLARGDSVIVCLLTLPDSVDRFEALARRACP